MAMQDRCVSKAQLWRRPAVWAAGTVALVVASGLGPRIFLAEALDEQADRRAGADYWRLAEFEQVYRGSTAAGVRRREPQRYGNSFSHSGEVDEASSTTLPSEAEANISAAPSDAESAECAEAESFPKSPVPVAVASQEPPSQPATETAPAAGSPRADSPKLHGSQTTEAAATGSPPAEPSTSRSPDWLKCNENGEPYEVTLADGTVLKLETYRNEYEGYDYRPPMRAEKAEVLVDYKRLHRDGVYGGEIHLDLKHKRMYWGDTPGGAHPSSIRRANLNGSNIQTVVDRHPLRPSTYALDVQAGKIYWVNAGRTNGEGRSIEQANLDGSHARTIVPRLAAPGGIAVDSISRKLYYFDDNNLMCSALDGSDETRVVADNAPGALLADEATKTLYWATNLHMIRRANYDGTQVGDAVNVGDFFGHIRHIAIDAKARKLYWTNESYGHIRRANFDGSKVEDVVVGINGPTGLDIDCDKGHFYWTESFSDGGIANFRIRRAVIPPPLAVKKKPAPPMVSSIHPLQQRSGSDVTLSGKHFMATKEVMFLDDSTGESKAARFTVRSDDELVIVVPGMSKRCRHPLIIVRGPGGMTVTLPRTVRVARRDAVDRFHPDDQFAYVVPAHGSIGIDRGVVVAMQSSIVTPAERGKNTFLLKDGAVTVLRGVPDNMVFFEPFALINQIDKPTKGSRFVPVAAIRPSFVASLLEVEDKVKEEQR